LLVDDNPGDTELTRATFEDANLQNALYSVGSGEEALAFLRHEGAYADPTAAPRPGLILLDIRMPGMDGLEVLRAIKSDPALAPITVVMLTGSDSDEDMIHSYQYGSSLYVRKPIAVASLVDTLQGQPSYGLALVAIDSAPEEPGFFT
jgi:CheY-like chemotaxis protein